MRRIAFALATVSALFVLGGCELLASRNTVTYWRCGGPYALTQAPDKAWEKGYYAIRSGKWLNNRLVIVTQNLEAPDLAIQRAESVAETLDIAKQDRAGFVLVLANATYWEPTLAKLESLGELIKSEMTNGGLTAEEAYPCVMPGFLQGLRPSQSPEPEVSHWKCEAQPPVENLKWRVSSDGSWPIFPREPLKTPFHVVSGNPQASNLAIRRAEWVAENLEVNDDRFVIAVANAYLQLAYLQRLGYAGGPSAIAFAEAGLGGYMTGIPSGGRFEPTPDKVQRFGELLKSEMKSRRQGAFQVFPCVMPVFLEMVDSR